jgi:hypothetical protein
MIEVVQIFRQVYAELGTIRWVIKYCPDVIEVVWRDGIVVGKLENVVNKSVTFVTNRAVLVCCHYMYVHNNVCIVLCGQARSGTYCIVLSRVLSKADECDHN